LDNDDLTRIGAAVCGVLGKGGTGGTASAVCFREPREVNDFIRLSDNDRLIVGTGIEMKEVDDEDAGRFFNRV